MLKKSLMAIIIISLSLLIKCGLLEPETLRGSLKIVLIQEKPDKGLEKKAETLNAVYCIVKKGSKEIFNSNLTLQGNYFHAEINDLEPADDYSVLLYGKNNDNAIIARGYKSGITVKDGENTVSIS